MLIEVHMIQNHSPANLNRDDLGAPKTCVFGGVTRARISSQCLKRSIRRSSAFQEALEKDGGVRTRRLITYLAKEVHGSQPVPDELVRFIGAVFEEGGVETTKKGDEPDNTKVIFFVPQSAIDEMVKALRAEGRRTAEAQKALAELFADILSRTSLVPDIALSGRMIELDRKGVFAKMSLGVEAALSAAHAVSTHEVTNEVDYFTAVDDLPGPIGAAHPDEAQFASACFYKYFCLDWKQLLYNLTPPGKRGNGPYRTWDPGNAPDDVKGLAAATLGHFLIAAATTTPSGKQNSFASHCEPSGILVEIKETKTPTSYANAFAAPAHVGGEGRPDDDGPDRVSLVGRSIAQLGDHVYSVRKALGIESTLLWYTVPVWRYPLDGWERDKDGRKAKDDKGREKPPVPLTDKVFESLCGKGGGPAGLVEAMIESLGLGLTWAKVKDAGKADTQEA